MLGGLLAITSCKGVSNGNRSITEEDVSGDFHTISAVSSVDVEYYQCSGESRVEIEAPEHIKAKVKVERKGDKLVVGFKGRAGGRNEYCIVKVYAPSVTTLEASASGDIVVPDGLDASGKVTVVCTASGDIHVAKLACGDLSLDVNGSGDIEIRRLECDALAGTVNASGDILLESVSCVSAELSSNGSGDIDIEGRGKTAVMACHASGDIEAEKFLLADVKAFNNGSGELKCQVDGRLVAENRGSGSIKYKGNPSDVQVKGRDVEHN